LRAVSTQREGGLEQVRILAKKNDEKRRAQMDGWVENE